MPCTKPIPRVCSCNANVARNRKLRAAAKRIAVECRDDGNREVADAIEDSPCLSRECIDGVGAGQRLQLTEVAACGKCPIAARGQDDQGQTRVCAGRLKGLLQGLQRVGAQGIAFLRPVDRHEQQRPFTHAPHALAHTCSSTFRSARFNALACRACVVVILCIGPATHTPKRSPPSLTDIATPITSMTFSPFVI